MRFVNPPKMRSSQMKVLLQKGVDNFKFCGCFSEQTCEMLIHPTVFSEQLHRHIQYPIFKKCSWFQRDFMHNYSCRLVYHEFSSLVKPHLSSEICFLSTWFRDRSLYLLGWTFFRHAKEILLMAEILHHLGCMNEIL